MRCFRFQQPAGKIRSEILVRNGGARRLHLAKDGFLLTCDAFPLTGQGRFLRGLRPAEAGQHGEERGAPHNSSIG